MDKNGKAYWRTHAVLDDGTEAVGFGKDFDLEDKVEVFYHYGQVKMRKKREGEGVTPRTQQR